jgi:hypothetical protein
MPASDLFLFLMTRPFCHPPDFIDHRLHPRHGPAIARRGAPAVREHRLTRHEAGSILAAAFRTFQSAETCSNKANKAARIGQAYESEANMACLSADWALPSGID